MLIGLGLTACAISPEIRAMGVLSILLFISYILFELIHAPHRVFKYMPFYFGSVANIAGCAVCEYWNLFLSELSTTSGYAGSLPLLVLSNWVFLVVIAVYDSCFGVEMEYVHGGSYSKITRMMTYFCFGCLLVMFCYVAPNPSFMLGVDRFAYASLVPPAFVKIWNWMAFLVIFPILSIKEGSYKVGCAAIALYILYAVWTGNKFGPFVTLLYLFIFVYYRELYSLGRERLTRVSVYVLLVLMVLVGGAILLQGATSSSARSDYAIQRLAQQGQLWWKTYQLADGDIHAEQFLNELDGLSASTDIGKNAGSRYGIYGIMYLTTPEKIVDAKLATGSRYTEAGHASAYYCFGACGAIGFSVFMGLLIAFVTNAMLKALHEGRFVEGMIFVRLHGFSRVGLSMGVFSQFATPLTVATIGFLVFMRLVRECNRAGTRMGTGLSRDSERLLVGSRWIWLEKPLDRLLICGDGVGTSKSASSSSPSVREGLA